MIHQVERPTFHPSRRFLGRRRRAPVSPKSPHLEASTTLSLPRWWSVAAITVTTLAVIYNGILAFLAARGLHVNFAVVAACEILILSGAALLVLRTKLMPVDASPLFLGYVGLLLGIALSLLNDRIFVDGIRNFAVITVFVMLGMRTEQRWVDRCFALLTVLVMLVLLIEIVSVPAYVALFEPASYYEATRGIQKLAVDKTGLFRNSIGFQGRLSFNPFSSFRTSSIFLEQVSLANFAGVLTIYLLTRWSALSTTKRIAFGLSLVLIVMTNSTRTTTILALVSVMGYWLYPRLPRLTLLLVTPLLIGVGCIAWYVLGDSYGDDIAGRVGLTMRNLANLDLAAILGLKVDNVHTFMDSGYPYLITSATLFGAIAFWLFVALFLPQQTDAQKRCAWSTTIFLSMNLLIGGTSVFSVKIAALLWLLAGSQKGQDAPSVASKVVPIVHI